MKYNFFYFLITHKLFTPKKLYKFINISTFTNILHPEKKNI